MTEVLLTLAIFIFAGLGLGIGLLFGRGPAKTSCGATACLPRDACLDCPNRRARNAEDQS